MSEGSDGSPDPQDAPPEDFEDDQREQLAQLRELRDLLAIPERRKVQRLEERLDALKLSAVEVGRVLPEAITLQYQGPDGFLLHALTPVIEEGLHTSVQKDPQRVADLLYPIIGPAIRKSIAEALAGFVQSLNQVLENSLSVRGFMWRLEAMRTGVSFGEVVLRNNLLFRVEQMFLIHKETGLPMQHLVAPEVIAQDSSLVSGMLTALQDFVRDSFTAPKGEGLAMLKVGELNVWIEQGPHAVLAAVIRGSAPETLRATQRAALENIHYRYQAELAAFDGDDSALEAARPLLEACMKAQYKPKQSQPSPALIIIVLGIVLGCGTWGYRQWKQATRWDAYVNRLNTTHGIVVNEQGRRSGHYYVSGLRDPLAPEPRQLLVGSGIKPAQVDMIWEEYQALFPEFLQSRARTVLMPPPTVTLTMQGRVLIAAGRAPHHWLVTARRLAPVIPGILGYQDRAVADLDAATIAAERAAIEKTVLLFPSSVFQVTPAMGAPLATLAAQIHRLLTAVLALDGMVQIRIVGHANFVGADTTATALSRQRADHVAEALRARNIPFPILMPVGVTIASPPGQKDDPSDRRVSFEVELFSPNLNPEQSP